MSTLEELETKINVLEERLSDVEGRQFLLEPKITLSKKIIQLRYFESTEEFFKLVKGKKYNVHVILSNFTGSGSNGADITLTLEYSTDNTIENLQKKRLIHAARSRNNLIFGSNITTICNFDEVVIPENAEYLRLYFSINVFNFINDDTLLGETEISINFFRPLPPTQIFVNN